MEETIKKAAVILHVDRKACFIQEMIERAGYQVTTYISPRDDVREIDTDALDLLYVGGGPQHIYELDKYPYLQDEMDLIRKAHAADKKIIGICLGAQLIAGAFGGAVYKGHNGPEIGWHSLHMTDEGAAHPVRHLGLTKIFQYHNDTLSLPDGAVLLASSDMYQNQIFSYGSAIGFQCHLEIRPEQVPQLVEIMKRTLENEGHQFDMARFAQETPTYIGRANEQVGKFVGAWLLQQPEMAA